MQENKTQADGVKSVEMEGKGRNHRKSEERAVLGRIHPKKPIPTTPGSSDLPLPLLSFIFHTVTLRCRLRKWDYTCNLVG